MKKTLLKIANLLYINMQYMNGFGLLNGKMGVALFFYEYGRYTNNEIYNNFADRILDDILDAIAKKKVTNSVDLSDGLGGLGWGIQYLINHDFVEGDSAEVLEDFDKKIQDNINHLDNISISDLSKYIIENKFMLGIDSYIYIRNVDSIYNLDNMRKIADFYYKILRCDKVYPLNFLNSCYSFLLLNNPKMQGRYTLLLKNELKNAYNKSIKKELYTNGDIKVFERFNEQEDRLFSLDYYPISVEHNMQMFMDVDAYLNYATMELLSYDNKYHLLDEKVLNKYLDEGMKDMPSFDLSLEKGLSGVGLSILKALRL